MIQQFVDHQISDMIFQNIFYNDEMQSELKVLQLLVACCLPPYRTRIVCNLCLPSKG